MEQSQRKQIMVQVYAALEQKGYCPTDQIIGYIISGDPAYITNYSGARQAITTMDRHELLKDIVADYFTSKA